MKNRKKTDALGTALKDLFKQKGVIAPDGELQERLLGLESEIERLQAENTALNSEIDRLKKESACHADTLLQKGIAELKSENFPEALGFFQAAVHFDRTNIKAMINLAVTYAELGYKDRGIGMLNRVLELEPDNDIAMRNLSFLREL